MDEKNESPSMRDSIEAAFEADAKVNVPDSTNVNPVADEPIIPIEKTDPIADDKQVTDPAAKAPVDPNKPADPNAKPADPAKPVAGAAKMPPGFPDVNHWNAMPEPTRVWIKNREAQFNQGLQRNAQAAQFGQQLADAMRPYEWMLQAKGVPPAKVVQETMAFNAVMTSGTPSEKQQMFLRAAKHYGVDLNALPAEGQQAAPVPPEVQELRQQVAQLATYLRGNEHQKAQQEASQAWSAVQTMAKDTTNYPHMDLVQMDMADLLERGMANSAHDAYQKAVWMRGDTRALMTGHEAAKRAEIARAAAAESTAHGGNAVAGSTKTQPSSIRAALNDAWDRAA